MNQRPRLYVIANPKRKPGVTAILDGLLPWLRKQATLVKVDHGGESDLSGIDADLVLVFGGDGSILSAARRLNGNPTPVFGVNMGQLGFLAETSPNALKRELPRVLKGEYVLSPRMMLQISVQPPLGARASRRVPRSKPDVGLAPCLTPPRGKEQRTAAAPWHPGETPALPGYLALNDAVLLRRPTDSMLSVRVTVCGEEVTTYKGDGLIVSTATGSTGYNLSAGGPILSERLKAMIVTPICPHTLANRPVVLSGEESVEVCAQTKPGTPAELVIDGQTSFSLESGSRVRIARAAKQFNLVTIGKRGRYEIIRDKLHWAGWVKERQ